jgi:hypothetical protein
MPSANIQHTGNGRTQRTVQRNPGGLVVVDQALGMKTRRGEGGKRRIGRKDVVPDPLIQPLIHVVAAGVCGV